MAIHHAEMIRVRLFIFLQFSLLFLMRLTVPFNMFNIPPKLKCYYFYDYHNYYNSTIVAEMIILTILSNNPNQPTKFNNL